MAARTRRAAPATARRPPSAPRASPSAARKPGPAARSLADPVFDSLKAVARLTGVERVARAMERFATSADRAAAVLDKLDARRLERLLTSADRVAAVLERIEIERFDELGDVLERLRVLADTAEQMNRSLGAIEQLANDTRRLVIGPLNRLPIPRRLRLGGDEPARSRASS